MAVLRTEWWHRWLPVAWILSLRHLHRWMSCPPPKRLFCVALISWMSIPIVCFQSPRQRPVGGGSLDVAARRPRTDSRQTNQAATFANGWTEDPLHGLHLELVRVPIQSKELIYLFHFWVELLTPDFISFLWPKLSEAKNFLCQKVYALIVMMQHANFRLRT